MKKYLTILGVIVFIVFLRINFKTANTYNSYLKNIYFNFLGIFTKNNTLEVSYTNEELEISSRTTFSTLLISSIFISRVETSVLN